MHGQPYYLSHPFPHPLRLWWGSTKRGSPGHPRNLFGSTDHRPSREDMFRGGGANGWIGSDGLVRDRGALHRLMARLTRRIRLEGSKTCENRRIPSGYTYLLQFIAHDLADTVVSFNIDGNVLTPSARNARSTPLLLDTLYGSGPDECPQAYELTSDVVNDLGRVPRMRLRLGLSGRGPRPQGSQYCPFRDIARGSPNSADSGITGRGWLTDPLMADPRNDAHSIISQLTVLFNILHNHVVHLLTDATSKLASPAHNEFDSLLARRELAYRRFRCARLVLALIYRNIIEKDVLCRILDDRIYKHYVRIGHEPLDKGNSVPVEFTFGAFRFAHSIVRDEYLINDPSVGAQKTSDALLRTCQRSPGNSDLLPLTSSWLIDWARFFGPAGSSTVNFSILIGPHYPAVLRSGTGEFAKFYDAEASQDPAALQQKTDVDAPGLAHRDLLSACYAGTLSVPALCQMLRAKGFNMVDEFSEWRKRLEVWLLKDEANFPVGSEHTRRISDDPPLPLFVMLEAEYSNGGQHLGPVGSIIVAETILGAMHRYPVGVEAPGSTLLERIKTCQQLFLIESAGDALLSSAFSELGTIATMPDLLCYMSRRQLFVSS